MIIVIKTKPTMQIIVKDVLFVLNQDLSCSSKLVPLALPISLVRLLIFSMIMEDLMLIGVGL